MTWLIALLALLAGASNPLQAGANAQLNKQLHSPAWATLVVYATGLAAILVALLLTRNAVPTRSTIATVPWWAWFGGLVSLVSTIAGLTLAQRLGSGLFTGLTLTASVIVSVLLDQFALAGFTRHPLSPLRAAGCSLLIAGVWLIARS